jgi:DNA-binding response OmpR family regulator
MTDVVLLVLFNGTVPDDHQAQLQENGYEIKMAFGVAMAHSMAVAGGFNAVVLVGGQAAWALSFMAELTALPCPVICLISANEAEEIALLDAGATVCLPPDSCPEHLLVWTRALLQLAGGNSRLAGFEFDSVARLARYGDTALRLRPIEFDILLHLALYAGHPVTGAELRRKLWPDHPLSAQRLAVSIYNLRAALAVAGADALLLTVPNAGYVLADERPIGARHRRSWRRRRRINRSRDICHFDDKCLC